MQVQAARARVRACKQRLEEAEDALCAAEFDQRRVAVEALLPEEQVAFCGGCWKRLGAFQAYLERWKAYAAKSTAKSNKFAPHTQA